MCWCDVWRVACGVRGTSVWPVALCLAHARMTCVEHLSLPSHRSSLQPHPLHQGAAVRPPFTLALQTTTPHLSLPTSMPHPTATHHTTQVESTRAKLARDFAEYPARFGPGRDHLTDPYEDLAVGGAGWVVG